MPSEKTKSYATRSKAICMAIAAGASLEAACAMPGMAPLHVVRRWLLDSPDFRRRYALARKLKAQRLVDEVVEIADGRDADAPPAVEAEDAPNPKAGSEAEVRRQRLRIDARKWAVAQFANASVFEADEAEAPLTYSVR